MKKLLVIIGLLFFMSVTALAQETPKAEVFGGYSYLRVDGQGGPVVNLNGWTCSVAGNVNHWFGLVTDISGHYGHQTIGGVKTSDSTHTVLFGPRFSSRKNEKVTPFFHALFGSAHFRTKINGAIFAENDFTMALGAGLDLKVNNNIALRVIQADYALARVSSNNLNNIRLSGGIVFRFGKK